jgi:hypothetical protein
MGDLNVSEKLSFHSGHITFRAAHAGGTGATTDAPSSQVYNKDITMQKQILPAYPPFILHHYTFMY